MTYIGTLVDVGRRPESMVGQLCVHNADCVLSGVSEATASSAGDLKHFIWANTGMCARLAEVEVCVCVCFGVRWTNQ